MRTKEKTYLPVITPGFERFDTVRYKNMNLKDDEIGRDTLPDGTVITMWKSRKRLYYREISPNSWFAIIKNYYLNGTIECKGLGFNHDRFNRGVWYYYDEAGNLEKTVDYDRPFRFTFEQVMEFCRKEGIYFEKGCFKVSITEFYLPQIYREYIAEQRIYYWEIRWFNRLKGKIEIIKLDGVTGREISREYMGYIY